jgi:hypothetical protein
MRSPDWKIGRYSGSTGTKISKFEQAPTVRMRSPD